MMICFPADTGCRLISVPARTQPAFHPATDYPGRMFLPENTAGLWRLNQCNCPEGF